MCVYVCVCVCVFTNDTNSSSFLLLSLDCYIISGVCLCLTVATSLTDLHYTLVWINSFSLNVAYFVYVFDEVPILTSLTKY